MEDIKNLVSLFFDEEKHDDPGPWEDGEIRVMIYFKDGEKTEGWINDYDNFQPDDGGEFFSYEELLNSAKGFERSEG